MDDLAVAHRLADAADHVTVARFRALDLRVDTKPDRTLVSDADRAAEDAIRELVARLRPGEGVLGEERGDDGADTRWVVDPIDGTANFVRGVPVWATLLALEREGSTVAAVVSAPALGRRWWAGRGRGAWAAGRRLAVSRVARLEDAGVSVTGVPRGELGERWLALTRRTATDRGLGDFWQHTLVAEGALDAALDPAMSLWDFLAVQLIVEEAGGRCTDLAGAPPSHGSALLATNGLVHDAVLAALAA